METKANHLAIGSFVLASIAGLMVFVLWLGKAEIDRKLDAYQIYFSGSVSGLSVASKVRYRGVPVGTVTAIGIDPDNSEQVLVIIEVTEGTPIKDDAVAALEMQGITGLVDVQITGGSKNSPRLVAKAGEPLPILASIPTKLEELLADVPNLLARATVLLDRAMLLLSDENLIAFTQTLANVSSSPRISRRAPATSRP
jgi:phospholipid/cholesterol/gamma-HCH transport system substrate-binding protein